MASKKTLGEYEEKNGRRINIIPQTNIGTVVGNNDKQIPRMIVKNGDCRNIVESKNHQLNKQKIFFSQKFSPPNTAMSIVGTKDQWLVTGVK